MSDPRRLREGAARGLDRALLESALEDRAAAGAEERALAALGLGAVAATGFGALAAQGASAPKAAAVASKVASAVLLKWLGIGVVATVAVSAPVTYLVVSRAERAATVAPAASAGPPQARAARTSPPSARPAPSLGASDEAAVDRVTASAAEAPAIAVSALADAPAPAPTTPASAPSTPASAPTTPAPAQRVSSLSPEIDVLDRARHALAAHDPVAARAALDEYQRRFPRGSLREEAELASIESLVLAGDSAGTREAAARFLAAHPDSAYAGRVRAIVKRAPNP
jgi:hypothetical protein